MSAIHMRLRTYLVGMKGHGWTRCERKEWIEEKKRFLIFFQNSFVGRQKSGKNYCFSAIKLLIYHCGKTSFNIFRDDLNFDAK